MLLIKEESLLIRLGLGVSAFGRNISLVLDTPRVGDNHYPLIDSYKGRCCMMIRGVVTVEYIVDYWIL